MGEKSSAQLFTRMMQKLLATLPLEHIAYFIDDLILFTTNIASHIDLLEQLFERLREANLTLAPHKCFLLREELSYVGVTVTKEGIKVNDERIEAIQRLQAPRNIGELQSILGTFNFTLERFRDNNVIILQQCNLRP